MLLGATTAVRHLRYLKIKQGWLRVTAILYVFCCALSKNSACLSNGTNKMCKDRWIDSIDC